MLMRSIVGCLLVMLLACSQSDTTSVKNYSEKPYLLDSGLETRQISFENPDGARGNAGKASSNLGVGRKGAASRMGIPSGETVVLCDIEGMGTIRHIWIGGSKTTIDNRGMVVRAWWDSQEHPSIECPLGDLMGFAHGLNIPYQSIAHSSDDGGARNIWLAMPFTERAKITLTNEIPNKTIDLWYYIDYTLGDEHPNDVGRLHVLFRRENPTSLKEDFEILPKRTGRGRYMGTVIGVRNLHPGKWWGEGEVKMYIDGDTDFPTLCGTGSEDYVCQSYGVHERAYMYCGCSLNRNNYVSMYRWHLVDPVVWRRDCRITVQQIQWGRREGDTPIFVETEDDWSCATFWYEPIPSETLPEMPLFEERVANLDGLDEIGP